MLLAKSHTDYSMFQETSAKKPICLASLQVKDLVDKSIERGYSAVALTDYNTMSGGVEFIQYATKKGIKPIVGTQLWTDDGYITLLCKHKKAWFRLCQIISEAHSNFNFKPYLGIKRLIELCEDYFIVYTGYTGSALHNMMGANPDLVPILLQQYIGFGRSNLYLTVQPLQNNMLSRSIATEWKIPYFSTGDTHYVDSTDAEDHRVLLLSMMHGINTANYKSKIAKGDQKELLTFFQHNDFYLPEAEVLEENQEILGEIADKCETFDVFEQPSIPTFGQENPNEYLRNLCRRGWIEKIKEKIPEEAQSKYVDRIKMELGVLQEAGLADYFLIVQDIVSWVKNKGWQTGAGRGSSSGCLVSYLTGITGINPIQYGLIFERFYNAGRNTPGRVTLPDIDLDFPISKREPIIRYIRDKYGKEYVSQMITFNRMQGRAALKDVLRVTTNCSFSEMNTITKSIPDEAKISDQIKEMNTNGVVKPGIISWALLNRKKDLEEWVLLREDGALEGTYADAFAQAMRLEGIKRTSGKHAAGIIISKEKLNTVCPMVHDKKGGDLIPGFSMDAMKTTGRVKFDILGIAALDKKMLATDIINNGKRALQNFSMPQL